MFMMAGLLIDATILMWPEMIIALSVSIHATGVHSAHKEHAKQTSSQVGYANK